jgi:curved DNA-binding protein CbpA
MEPTPPLDPYVVLQILHTAEDEVIRAAFRALAFKFHPDRDPSEYAARRMSEINLAYALIKTPGARAAFDRRRRMSQTVEAADISPLAAPVAVPSDAHSARLSFGRYSGWSLSQVARWDIDYLRWLSRHSSGIRFKAEIDQLLRSRGATTTA